MLKLPTRTSGMLRLSPSWVSKPYTSSNVPAGVMSIGDDEYFTLSTGMMSGQDWPVPFYEALNLVTRANRKKCGGACLNLHVTGTAPGLNFASTTTCGRSLTSTAQRRVHHTIFAHSSLVSADATV